MNSNSHEKTPKKRGKTLPMLAVLLAVSGIIRPLLGNNLAYAQDSGNSIVPEDGSTEVVLGIPFSEDAIDRLLQAFKERERRLLQNEGELVRFRKTLNDTKAQIAAKIDELTEVEGKLARTLAIADSATENDLNRLTAVYENMKPRDTAKLFAEMEPSFAAGFLGLMQAESAAAVMNELEPDTAYTISVMLAGRNANAFNFE